MSNVFIKINQKKANVGHIYTGSPRYGEVWMHRQATRFEAKHFSSSFEKKLKREASGDIASVALPALWEDGRAQVDTKIKMKGPMTEDLELM